MVLRLSTAHATVSIWQRIPSLLSLLLLLAPESGDCTEAEGGVADDGRELKEEMGGGCCCFIRYSEPGNSKSLVDERVQPQTNLFESDYLSTSLP